MQAGSRPRCRCVGRGCLRRSPRRSRSSPRRGRWLHHGVDGARRRRRRRAGRGASPRSSRPASSAVAFLRPALFPQDEPGGPSRCSRARSAGVPATTSLPSASRSRRCWRPATSTGEGDRGQSRPVGPTFESRKPDDEECSGSTNGVTTRRSTLSPFERSFPRVVRVEVESFTHMDEAISRLQDPDTRFDVFFPTIDPAGVDRRGLLRPLDHGSTSPTSATSGPGSVRTVGCSTTQGSDTRCRTPCT